MLLLPCDLSQWREIQSALTDLSKVCTIEDLASSLGVLHSLMLSESGDSNGNYNAWESNHPFGGLLHFLKHDTTPKENSRFWGRVMPTIATLASEIDTLRPADSLQYSVQQQESITTLDRRFVSSVVACAFLCLFPDRHNHNLNAINFDEFFQFLMVPCQRSQSAKLRCILHYFERLSELQDKGPHGKIIFARQVLSKEDTLNIDSWSSSIVSLCPLIVRQEGRLEDMGSEALQVDFANCYIGGGVLGAGRVQEEIRFCICPELLVSMLFMERMEDNEAIVISGYEQFSKYSGYAGGLKFAGDYRDISKVNQAGNLDTCIVAIDANPTGGREIQYMNHNLTRELKKAFTGFRQHKHQLETMTGVTQSGDGSHSMLDAYCNSLSKDITNVAVQDAKSKEEFQIQNAAKKLANNVVPEILTNAFDTVPSLYDDTTGVRILPCVPEHASSGAGLLTKKQTSVDLDSMATHWAHGILEGVLGTDRPGSSDTCRLPCKICTSRSGSISRNSTHKIDKILSTFSEDFLHKLDNSSAPLSIESRSSRDSLEDYSIISSLSCKSDSFVKVDLESDMDSVSGSQSSKTSVFSVEALVKQIMDDAYIKLYGTSPLLRRSSKSSATADSSTEVHNTYQQTKKDGLIQVSIPTIPNEDQPWTPPPSPMTPDVGLPTRLDDSASRLEMCSERLRASISSGDSSYCGGNSAPLSAQDVQIRECAEQVVSRTIAESLPIIGGSLTTHSSSSSSRRSSSRTSSIPCSSGSKRSSIDTFTEDLLKIANIDPYGKRPSRTEESLAFFAEEMQRRVEDDEHFGERRKSELAEFAEELFKSKITITQDSPDLDLSKYTRPVDFYAEREATVVISDAFVQIFGRPWSEAYLSDMLTSDSEVLESDMEIETGPDIHRDICSHFTSNQDSSNYHVTEDDLISMATNLSNIIIESALRVYQEQLRQEQCQWWEMSSNGRMDRDTGQYNTLSEYAAGTASDVVKESLETINDGDCCIQGATPELSQDGFHQLKPIATGNWGCGAFGGDPQLKSLIQWLAASQAGRPALYYYTFHDKRVIQLEEVVEIVKTKNWTVGELAKTVFKYGHALSSESSSVADSLFGHILHLP